MLVKRNSIVIDGHIYLIINQVLGQSSCYRCKYYDVICRNSKFVCYHFIKTNDDDKCLIPV